MERPSEAEKARTTRRVALAAKNKREGVLCLYPHPPTGHKSLALPPLQHPKPTRSSAPSRPSEVKLALAAVAVDLNVRLRLADMPPTTQELAFRHTRSLLDSSPNTKKPSPTHLAMCLKKVFSELNNQKYHIESWFFESSSQINMVIFVFSFQFFFLVVFELLKLYAAVLVYIYIFIYIFMGCFV